MSYTALDIILYPCKVFHSGIEVLLCWNLSVLSQGASVVHEAISMLFIDDLIIIDCETEIKYIY